MPPLFFQYIYIYIRPGEGGALYLSILPMFKIVSCVVMAFSYRKANILRQGPDLDPLVGD